MIPAPPVRFRKMLKEIRNPENSYCGVTHGVSDLPDNILLFVRTDGSLTRNNRLIPVNQHHRFVLVTALAGSGAGFVNGCHFVITPGQGMLVFPHQLHYFQYDCRDILWVMTTFELAHADPYQRLRDQVFTLSAPARDVLQRLGERFWFLQRARTQRDDRLPLLTALLLAELGDTQPAVAPPHTAPQANHRVIELVEQVNAFINANLERNPSVAEIARLVSYSASHLRQLYRQTTGLTIGAYIEHMKMRHAQAYLVTGGLNVSQTAEKCGYESLYAFSRAFKRYNGCAPSRYRGDPHGDRRP